MGESYDVRSGVGWNGSSVTLTCERCGNDLLAGRPESGWVLEHLQAIAELHYGREHAERLITR
jgi:hypothetical protein